LTDKNTTESVRNWTVIIYTVVSVLILFLIYILLASKLSNDYQEPKDLRVERIKPIGQVNLAGSEAVAATPVATVAAAPKSGKEVYDGVCFACHASGVLGAPKFHNQADWASRIAKGKDVLLQSAINGLNNMPARGGNPSLQDEELKAAIEYMLGE
jgi:cytochrome c5